MTLNLLVNEREQSNSLIHWDVIYLNILQYAIAFVMVLVI